MLGNRIVLKRGNKDEGEKPFWISFSDLMTALMVLFLVVMGVALLAVTKNVTEREKQEEQYRKDVEELFRRFENEAKKFSGIKVDRQRGIIDFGQRANFDFGKYDLSVEKESALREFVPTMLALANDELGQRVLKRYVIEGYTDQQGSYLTNLNLSLNRSQRVLCTMFATSGDKLLTEEQKTDVRDLFLVGGYSFNSAKPTPEESRRVEMRVELLSMGERRNGSPTTDSNFGRCAI